MRWRSRPTRSPGFGAVWTTDFDDSVVRRLDAASGKVLATVQVEGNPIGIIAGGDSIWTAGYRLGLVSRIDPATNREVEAIRVGPDGPSGAMRMAAQARYVYVDIYSTSTVVQIDTRTGRVTKRIRVQPLTACGRLIPESPGCTSARPRTARWLPSSPSGSLRRVRSCGPGSSGGSGRPS
ncbi:MAG: hypothetical protein H0U35_00200 [Sporichthyaceae bacterium]|nr:hypothetical protein [Sporichthyaceae bacterium]